MAIPSQLRPWARFPLLQDDVKEAPVELYHRLKLYDDTGAANPKKPVVHEVYDEVVFWQPTESFFNRMATHVPRAAPPSQLAQFYLSFAPDAEYQRIQRARQRLAQIRANVENTAAQLEAQEASGAVVGGWPGS